MIAAQLRCEQLAQGLYAAARRPGVCTCFSRAVDCKLDARAVAPAPRQPSTPVADTLSPPQRRKDGQRRGVDGASSNVERRTRRSDDSVEHLRRPEVIRRHLATITIVVTTAYPQRRRRPARTVDVDHTWSSWTLHPAGIVTSNFWKYTS